MSENEQKLELMTPERIAEIRRELDEARSKTRPLQTGAQQNAMRDALMLTWAWKYSADLLAERDLLRARLEALPGKIAGLLCDQVRLGKLETVVWFMEYKISDFGGWRSQEEFRGQIRALVAGAAAPSASILTQPHIPGASTGGYTSHCCGQDMGLSNSDSEIDGECRKLVHAMNLVPGIHTTSSCCGHGDQSYRVFFIVDSLAALPGLLYWFDACHSGCAGWTVTVHTDCGMSPASFCVEGPIGQQGYIAAEQIAKLMAAAPPAAGPQSPKFCPDCAEAMKIAYSDATTPGFFSPYCPKHQQSSVSAVAPPAGDEGGKES